MTTPLNPNQEIAVKHVEGPLLVLAGAGSGKTRIVTHRVAHLLKLGVPSSEILAVTFTNKAAAEMRHRILQITHKTVLTCTFHSLCAKILRESIHHLGYSRSFVIYDEDDSEKVLKGCLNTLGLKDEKGLFKSLKSQISQAKNALQEPEEFVKADPQLYQVYTLYQNNLKSYNALDFDDLLFLTVALFEHHTDVLEAYQKQWSFILIDEYQDTNAAQYTIAQSLGAIHRNIFAVGDPDQSIYSWRGANIQNILNFEKDFPGAKVIPLEQNYRSRSNILEAANALIQHNTNRYKKNLWSDRGEGDPIGLFIAGSEREEADFVIRRLKTLHQTKGVPLNDCVIFYRTNSQSRLFEDALLRDNLPYQIIGGLSFYQRREIKDILALLRLVHSGSDFVALVRTINLPKRGLGDVFLNNLREFAIENQIDILACCLQIVDHRLPFKISAKQFEGLKQYTDMICALKEMIKAKKPIHEVITQAIHRSHYLNYLKEDPESFEERQENIEELVSKAAEWEQEVTYPSLEAFLEEISLKSSTDEKGPAHDTIRLMTLHNGKGLEFTAVFLVGMEEDLFPHANSRESAEALEEERRLCYVGMTRAKEHLCLSAASSRYLWGMPRMMRPSRFLKEIPSHFLQKLNIFTSYKSESPKEDAQEAAFEAGETVFHKDFGSGIIQKTYTTSLGLTYDVFFPQARTTRSLVAKFAKLNRVIA